MKRSWWAVAALALAVRGVDAQTTLIADTHVNAALPAVNSGAISNVNVGGGYTGLLQFDLSLLPAGTTAAQISRAVLRVYVNRVDAAGLVSVAPITAGWSEYGVTYATMPATGSAAQVFQVSQAAAYVAVDVTTLVQGWVAAPATNFGVALTAGSAVAEFDSKENDLTGHGAALDVTIVSQGPAGAAGAAGATGPQGPAGVAGPAGAQGVAGAAGPAGISGAQGIQGIQGLPGLGFLGTYASTANYGLDDVVAFQGSSYISLIASNHGNTPGFSASAWAVLAAAGVGTTGATGAMGPQGPVGPQGATGATGAAGAAGSNGAAGTPGLVYQGTYASTTNYALGDVVLWSGASYASLVAGNHGNTPSLSPAYWGVLTAQGPQGATGAAGPQGPTGATGSVGSTGPPGQTGPQGAQGIAGTAGAQGLTGATGAQGLSGPAGPQGLAGPVGLEFKGAYSSVTNYALADGVSWQGSGYVSLIANNHGNTPDQSPAQWALFAQAGAVGATGATGAQGLTGPAGAQGLQGTTGATGAQGPQGAQGPAVVNYTGNYASTTNYAVADAASFGGSTYVSLVAANHGNTPGLSPAYWAVLAAQGPAGATGAQGPQGLAGTAGASGATGSTGPQGPPVAFAGGWVVGTSYPVGAAVSYGGGSYIATVANVGREPDVSPTYWGVLAQAGSAGPAGATGATGLQGPTGFPGPAGATGAMGATGVAGPAGPAGATGPAGPVGATGAAGATGAVGLNYRGTFASTTNYAPNDGVLFQGASYVSLLAGNAGNTPGLSPSAWGLLAAPGATGAAGAPGAAGMTGAVGATGPAGAAATVQVGTVATGAAGSSASVTNTGTAAAAVLNFTIPQGAAGTGGSGTGSSGTSGIPLLTMYHAVSYAATYYSVNNTNQAATETPAVLSWVPNGCSATQLVAFSQQAQTITVTLRTGTLGAMADSALSCSVATGQSCTATGTVTVPAGGFLDFGIYHPDSNPSAVWVALTCN